MHDGVIDLLLSKNLITPDDIREAESARRNAKISLLDALISLKKISPEEAADAVAEYYGLERAARLGETRPAQVLPAELARKHRVFPVKVEGDNLYVATDDPTDVGTTDALRVATGMNVVPVVCTARELDRAIQKWYGGQENVAAEEEDVNPDEFAAEIRDSPAVRLVREIIEGALSEGASDVHIEPRRGKFVVRLRVNGVLVKKAEYPKQLHQSVISRIKVMSGLNIAERRLPQDGRARIVEPRDADLRVSILPTVHGEKAVLRIFDRSQAAPRLEALGYEGDALAKLREAYKAPYGMILVTGPTGSGKTTSLYAALNELISDRVNIVTVEDPPEYELPGVNHVAVNARAGLDFAAALRSILRQDPDVILVGEIRDSETARVAVQAALTGHLVLSTLHTNDAASAPVRLVDMGVEPYLVASSLLCVVAQRLVRTVCPRCREEYSLPPDSPAGAFMEGFGQTAWRGIGCPRCGYTGYVGRTAVAEVMRVTRTIRELIRRNAAADEIRDAAMREGMTPLAETARAKVASGVTTVEDAMKVVYSGWD
ncbi:type II secretion system protein E [Moorella sp. E308F]|uniref:GspE/PulE family protein n=1 Tax=unclassified Neomoorella TaxID=2676739 RepID=UPI0010FFC668|nr:MULTISPECIES: GspE/PulE family protein [unclassified Moorella (in: firmicutes)]GEA15418.1 type II secretion system protein E [Moorella sp. E308F]GEA19722.1 type II secretion system protein E [Moorella sp. E306M]